MWLLMMAMSVLVLCPLSTIAFCVHLSLTRLPPQDWLPSCCQDWAYTPLIVRSPLCKCLWQTSSSVEFPRV